MQTISNHTLRTVISPIAFALSLVLIWELVCDAFTVSKFVLPRPASIGPMFLSHWAVIGPNAAQTLGTTVAGFFDRSSPLASC